MAFYTHYPTAELAPLFRLLDDYDAHRTTHSKQKASTSKPHPKQSFTPRFDVREVNDSYYLDGELPGAQQDNIEIEFTDPHTLVIKGKITHSYEVHHDSQTQIGAETSMSSGASSPKSYRPTVEDANEDGDDTAMSTAAESAPQTSPLPPEDANVNKSQSSFSKSSSPQFKYWVSERSFGEFCRTFNFPQRVNQDAVRANLKDGILSVVVPKAPAHTAKKIRVE